MPVDAAARGLVRARLRTLGLTDFDDAELTRQHSPLMSPLVWDLAHIGQQEDLWLLRGGNAAAQGLLPAQIEKLYDAFEHPRARRVELPLLTPREARSFIADVRDRVFERLQSFDIRGTGDEDQLFAYAMVEQHEQQHVETMLATHQLRSGEALLGRGAPLPPGRPTAHDSVLVPGGPFVLGVDGTEEPWSLDNERPAHVVDLPAFRIARFPVTNAEWLAFIDSGGYAEPGCWSARGWAHRVAAELERPLFWSADGSRRRFGVVEEIPPDEPVQHVCFFEAEAYAAWAGARLPTEQEWEKACAWDPATAGRRRWPWGSADPSPSLANLGGEALRPAQVGAYPAGASGVRSRAVDRRRVGVDVLRLRTLAGVRADALRAVQRAVLRRRLPRAARRLVGGRRRGRPAVLPQLGSAHPPADLLRLAASLGCVGSMCRHLAWLGAPRTVAALVLEPPAGLLRQSYAPRRQKRGLLNADGWGVGLYGPDGAVHRWRSARPLWGDASFASIAPLLTSGAVLAAVRSATVGMPPDETAAAPFTDGRWLLSHNGRVSRAALPLSLDAESTGDSAMLAAHVFAAGAANVAGTLRAVAAADPDAFLSVLMTDGSRIVGVTWGDELSYLVEPDGVVVASEPWDDDPRWVDVPDRRLIEVTPAGVAVSDLEID